MSSIRFTLGKKLGLATLLAYVGVVVLGIIGWIMNIAAIVPLLDGDFTPWLIARIVGVVFFPLGAVLGWF